MEVGKGGLRMILRDSKGESARGGMQTMLYEILEVNEQKKSEYGTETHYQIWLRDLLGH